MSPKFKKVVLDGRTINVPKSATALERRLRNHGAINSHDAMVDKMQQLKAKYGTHTLVI